MSFHWVKLKDFHSVKVFTRNCDDVDDFIKACKKELQIPNPPQELSLSTTINGTAIRSGCKLVDIPAEPGYIQNDDENPLFISNQVKEIFLSMAYGKATMSFIHEATGVKDDIETWENIPIDSTIEPSQEFVELFKKNCSVFEFASEASRRIVIDLFIREVVAQFPAFVIVCEYYMTLVNEKKSRGLKGWCDYTICHRGLRTQPHLIAIEAKMSNTETLLQCVGECASIHYSRKRKKMKNLCVYGIHSTGSAWKFVFIDETGSLFVSKEYLLNSEVYVKEGFDHIYRLVYYVVKQSHTNSPRTSPAASSESFIQ